MKKHPKNWWGFDTKAIDTTVRPQDDFYHYANGAWIAKTKIPPEESRWGSFNTLRYETETELRTIVTNVLKKKNLKKGSPEQLVRDTYISATDLATRKALGVSPMTPLLAMVNKISTLEDLLASIAHFHLLGISCFWNTFVDQDSKNSDKYLLHLWQGGLSLPDREYYLADKPEQKRVRDAYQIHIEKLLKLAGKHSDEIAHTKEVVMKLETLLAKASMSKEDTRDPEKTYNKLSIAQIQKLSPVIEWRHYFAQTETPALTHINVGQLQFFKDISRLLQKVSLAEWKIYLEWHVINNSASLLSEPFVEENFDFYSRTMSGAQKMKPLWRRGLGAVNGTVGEALGVMYVKRYFPASAKKAMDELVTDLFVVYEERMKQLDWMSAATKRKAIFKLRAMGRKIGYPTKLKGYAGLNIFPDDFFGNMLRANLFEHKREMKKLRGPVDRSEWFMHPQVVNAYFAPNLNEIVFPAAILQWPFFDPRADAAVNYAGIGSVIGHELTHSFDDKGSKFDARGNMKNWWSLQDRKRFDAKTKMIEKQANAFEVLPGINLNGKLTLGESIADLGGLVIAFDAYQKHLKKTGRKDIQGLSPEKRFFLGFAQMEREVSREEFLKMITLVDPHPASTFRINGPLSNFDPFYETFSVQKTDKIYRDSKNRARIW